MKRLLIILMAVCLLCITSGAMAAEKLSVLPKSVKPREVTIAANAIDAPENVYILDSGVMLQLDAGFVRRGTKNGWVIWDGSLEEGTSISLGFHKQSRVIAKADMPAELEVSGYDDIETDTIGSVALTWGTRLRSDDTYDMHYLFTLKNATYSIEAVGMRDQQGCSLFESLLYRRLVKTTNSKIHMNQDSLSLYPGQSYQLVANETGKENATYTFKSSKSSVATVAEDGTVTAVTSGSANITVKSSTGKSLKVKVTVHKPAAIVVPEKSLALQVGDVLLLEPTMEIREDATIWDVRKGFTFVSSDTGVVAITKEGEITAKQVGTATITITCGDSTLDVPVTVSAVPKNSTYRALLIANHKYQVASQDRYGNYRSSVGMKTLLGRIADKYTVTMKENRTAKQIIADIAATFTGVKDTDVSLFYFAGHGASDGSLCGVGMDYANVSTQELYKALSAIPGRVIVILDCCYSGTVIASDGTASSASVSSFNSAVIRTFSKDTIEDVWSQAQPSDGELRTSKFLVISAASQNEESWSFTGYSTFEDWTPLLSYYLMKGAGWDMDKGKACNAAADKNQDKNLTLSEAYSYAYGNVLDFISQNHDVLQHVQVWPKNSNAALFHLK